MKIYAKRAPTNQSPKYGATEVRDEVGASLSWHTEGLVQPGPYLGVS